MSSLRKMPFFEGTFDEILDRSRTLSVVICCLLIFFLLLWTLHAIWKTSCRRATVADQDNGNEWIEMQPID